MYSLFPVHIVDHLVDTRDFRQVPDTQEVFVSPTSAISVIVEVLESVAATDLREAAGYEAFSWSICRFVTFFVYSAGSTSMR